MARFLITCGPTREFLDPVRYLTNGSSGKTGLAIASRALARGHQVDLVLGPVEAAPPAGARVARVVTCAEMLEAARRLHPSSAVVIGAAAVCDFRPLSPQASKRSRRDGAFTLELAPNPDILAELARAKGARVHAGFALETGSPEEALARARKKLLEKELDWIVLNSPEAMEAEAASYLLLDREGRPRDLGRIPKGELAAILIEEIEKSLKSAASPADTDR